MKKADRYLSVEPWGVEEKGFHPDRSRTSESLFSLANEYLGVRGFFEEDYSGDRLVGSYVNGVYEEKLAAEPAGYKGISNRVCFMVNTVNWLAVRILAEGQILDLHAVDFGDFSRRLDFRTGLLTRSFVWKLSGGKRLKLRFERLVSMDRGQFGYQRISFEALDHPVDLEIDLSLDFSFVHEQYKQNFWRVDPSASDGAQTAARAESAVLTGTSVSLGQKLQAQMRVATNHQELTFRPSSGEKRTSLSAALRLMPGAPLSIEREVQVLHLNRPSGPMQAEAASRSFDEALAANGAYWDQVWGRSDIRIDGDELNQQGIRYCIFQMEQTYRGNTPGTNIGAKGLTGEFYNGNAFWDTEVYCFPYYLFSNPAAARQLLDYRFDTLPQALERAKALDCRGACFPIATIDGTESCTLWQHASLQFQPTTGVAYALWHYEQVTGDLEYFFEKGLELLVQTSRFLVSRCQWSERKQQYGFFGVMGPDEFQMMVNHNAYTNYMAKRSLEYTGRMLGRLKAANPARTAQILSRLGHSAEDGELFARVAELMYIPRDKSERIVEQHEGFFDLPHQDIHAIPVEEFPLYHHWSYDRIYRNDMIKQPDVLMFLFLYNQSFSPEEKLANYEYYEPRCIHESSLSPSVHSILATELGKHREALEFFQFATRIDLDNYNRNTREGLHVTAISGAWMNIVYGFGGFRSDGPVPVLNPVLPAGWKGYSFQILYRGSRILVEVDAQSTVFRVLEGPELDVEIGSELRSIDSSGVRLATSRGAS